MLWMMSYRILPTFYQFIDGVLHGSSASSAYDHIAFFDTHPMKKVVESRLIPDAPDYDGAGPMPTRRNHIIRVYSITRLHPDDAAEFGWIMSAAMELNGNAAIIE